MSGFFIAHDRMPIEVQKQFRAWPHALDNYKPLDSVSPMWHPIVRDECDRINAVALGLTIEQYRIEKGNDVL